MNFTTSPSLKPLAVQKSAHPFVNEQHVCFPNVVVVVFTVHVDRGPLRVYQMPSNPSDPCIRQYAVGTSCEYNEQDLNHHCLHTHLCLFAKHQASQCDQNPKLP